MPVVEVAVLKKKFGAQVGEVIIKKTFDCGENCWVVIDD